MNMRSTEISSLPAQPCSRSVLVLLFTSVFVTVSCSSENSGNAADKSVIQPNIVFVIADQMQAYAMGASGNEQIITPNLDRLASQGVITSNAISGHPVCTPFRAQLLTGRYSHSTGVILNDIRLPDDAEIFPEILQEEGYTTGYIGKWHLSGDRNDPVDAVSRRGWDYWAVRNVSHRHDETVYWLNDSHEPTRAEGWEPDVQTDLAIEFIEANKEKPFSLFMSFGPPHNPYPLVPEEYVDLYEGVDLVARPNVAQEDEDRLRDYYAAVSSIDVNIGRLSAALEGAGVADNTIFVFTADHGDMLGSQGHVLKQRPWEESINIPFILRYPDKINAGQATDWIVTTVDMMPTVLGLSDIAVPDVVEGMDLSGVFAGTSDTQREAAFLFNVHKDGGPGTDWRGIRTKKWIYARHYRADWVLYDLENDPYELNNLIDDDEYSNVKEDLKQRLETMRTNLGESLPLVGVDPAPIVLPE